MRVFRIIPAYAGSTPSGFTGCRSTGDHPRIRGEHSTTRPLGEDLPGSSPHTRGAPRRRSARRCRLGIIPAYAGSTNLHHYLQEMRWDHPRIRGEHQEGVCSITCTPGSSPHTRGAPSSSTSRPLPPWIIPAYAGSTPREMCRDPSSRGSSPHTRGAPSQRPQVLDQGRIIPAYAGSTSHP